MNKKALKLLGAIVEATKKNDVYYITKAEAESLANDPQVIEVNQGMIKDGKAASRATAAGIEMINTASNTPAEPSTSEFALITGAEVPKSKRGGGRGGAPSKYPFEKMEVGMSFFLPKTAERPDPVKSLQSSIAAVNHKYSEGTGEFETVERTKRGEGNKAVKDANGNNVRETVQREKRKAIRKYVVREVKGGQTYGTFKPEYDGALVTRTL